MKRAITAKRVLSPAKQKLRNILDAIYREVYDRNLNDWWGNINSAGKGYICKWWRTDEELFTEEQAEDFAESLQEIITQLGYDEYCTIEFNSEHLSLLEEDIHTVILRVNPAPDPIVTWPDGSEVSEEELLEVVAFMFGESTQAAKHDIEAYRVGGEIKKLQALVNNYAKVHPDHMN